MLKIQIADTDIDINSHNYHKNDTRNLRLGLVISANDSVKKTFCYLRCLTCTTKAADGGLGWVCKTTGGLGDGSPPAGSRGGALVGGLWGQSPPEAEEF